MAAPIHACVVALAGLLASCAHEPPVGRTTTTAAVAQASSTLAPAPAPAPAPAAADVAVEVKAPQHARYNPIIGAATKPSLGIVVTNRGAEPLDVSNLVVYLEAVREGVDFRCAKEVGPQVRDREPAVLETGESHTFERELDCALPLVGAYAVRVGVSFGEAAARTSRDVSAFNLTVTALPNIAPREVEGLPGVWASMGSTSKLAGGVNRGYGHTLLTLVNSTPKPIALPRLRLAFRVYRPGNPVACEDKPVVLDAPAVLEPGDAYNEAVEVSCLGLSVAGTYDVLARLVVPRGSEGDREISMGKLRVEIVTDPTLLIPPLRY